MILAELPIPSSLEFAGWIFCAGAALWFWNQLRKAIDREKDKPSPAEVRHEAHQIFTPREEFTQHVEANESEFLQIATRRQHDVDAASDSRKKLYDQIDGVRKELNKKIDDMPGKIVADLVNAKNLWRNR